MPWTSHYFADGAYVTFTGHVTGRDVVDANAAFYARPYIHGPRFSVFDFAGVERVDVDGAALRRVLEQDLGAARHIQEHAAAIVAPDYDVYVLARVWQTQVEETSWRTKVVRSRADALCWLREQRLAMARSGASPSGEGLAMPWTADYVADGAYIAFFGHTTGRDLVASVREFFAHRFDDGPHFALIDFSGVDVFDVEAIDIDRLVDEQRRTTAAAPDLAVAVVAPQPVEYGLSRMWEMRLEPTTWRIRIVTTVPDALRWLGEHGVDTGRLAVSHG